MKVIQYKLKVYKRKKAGGITSCCDSCSIGRDLCENEMEKTCRSLDKVNYGYFKRVKLTEHQGKWYIKNKSKTLTGCCDKCDLRTLCIGTKMVTKCCKGSSNYYFKEVSNVNIQKV